MTQDTTGHPGRVAVWVTVLLTLASTLAACSSEPEAAEPAAAATRSPSRTPTSSANPGVPEPGSMDPPATTSGPLSRHSFPTPRELGAGWRYKVDPGSAEEGYAGNGTPTLARSPQEIVQTAVPFGCARRAPLPSPTHALEVDYTFRDRSVIAVRSKFADSPTAEAFFDARASNLRACEGHAPSQGIGPLVEAVTSPDAASLSSARTPKSDPWRELAVLDRDTVVLVAVQGTAGLTDSQTRHLVTLFRH